MLWLIGIITLGIMALIFGLILGFSAIRFKVQGDPLVDQIDAVLPQTQCGQCGYPGCRPYAEAIANGEEINKCPPGGEATIQKIADLTGRDPKPLDAAHGVEEVKKVAYIHEDECIGCTKCIQACPVDAIIGATRQMHTIIADECTGCDLCVEPCPVDCIEMIPVPTNKSNWQWELGDIPIQVLPTVAQPSPSSLLHELADKQSRSPNEQDAK